MVSEVAGDGTT